MGSCSRVRKPTQYREELTGSADVWNNVLLVNGILGSALSTRVGVGVGRTGRTGCRRRGQDNAPGVSHVKP